MKSMVFTGICAAVLALALPAMAQDGNIEFGDDTSLFANDGECDDPRFTGPGVGSNLDWTSVGNDATDCRASVKAGARYWFGATSIIIPDCSAVDFGADGGDYANDDACDDPRFVHPEKLASSILLQSDLKQDATDCREICESGRLFLRPLK